MCICSKLLQYEMLAPFENKKICETRSQRTLLPHLQETKHIRSARPQVGFGIGTDADQQETREWMDALSAVIDKEGPARPLPVGTTSEHARQNAASICRSPRNTGYVNTIGPAGARCPGNIAIEKRLRAYMRWNAMAMVVRPTV